MDMFEAKTKERRDWARKVRVVGLFILLATIALSGVCYALNIPVDVALTPWVSIPITFGAVGGIATVVLGMLQSY